MLVHERRQHPGLAREPAPELEILGDPRVQQLHGHVAAQAAVARAPDRAHAPLTDASLELVAAGDEVGHVRECGHVRDVVRRAPRGKM